MRAVTVLIALGLLALTLWVIPSTRSGMLVLSETVSASMPRMLTPGR
ncbi:hypothetical protein [Brevundimonas sp.]|jgi:hypothetical protein|nr:hypothetical protein [Brevundimonas sp.]